ncbi:MAG: glycosyltransferase [Chloroflexota bacterium]
MTSSFPERPLVLAHFASDVPEHVCPVLRVKAPAQAAGWQVLAGVAWEEHRMKVLLETVECADAVLIQRDFPAHVDVYHQVLAAARLHHKPVIYEIDDLLTELPEEHPGVAHFLPRRAAILAAIAQADAVTCTTQPLAAYLRAFNPRVSVLPNYLLDALWPLRPHLTQDAMKDSRPLVIGYLGSASHVPDLAMLAPLLAGLLDRYGERLLLRLWGIAAPPELAGRSNVQTFDVGLVEYAQFAAYFARQQCDLFIAPLQDSAFNRCKSAIKFLEYSALGVPGVYSNLPPYADVITPGQDGLLADGLDPWLAHLVALIENDELRRQMGRAAQETVRHKWLLSSQGTVWEAEMRRLVDSCRPVAPPSHHYFLAEKFLAWNQADRQQLQQQQENLTQLEKRLSILQQEHTALRTRWEQAQEDLLSPGWRFFKLADAFRLKLAPSGSRRAQALGGMAGLAFRLKHRLLDPVLRRLVPERFADIPVERSPLKLVVEDGAALENATVHVLVERNPFLLPLDEAAVLAWAARQTCRDVQVVAWDSVKGIAESLTGEPGRWDAPDLEALCCGLSGPYLCFACNDLLLQSETYLEANQLALASEKLAFTVNARGPLDWPLRHLHRSLLPGCRLTPFFRQVVCKKYVRSDFSLDLADRLAGLSQPDVVGKLLTHTTADPEVHMAYPMETALGNVDVAADGRYVLGRPAGSAFPWEPLTHRVQSVNTALPVHFEQDERPTVIVVFPFLAVGGAEQLHLNLIEYLQGQIRFVVLSVDAIDPSLGTLAESFRALTPYVYQTEDFLASDLRLSFFEYLVTRFRPAGFYLASGTPWAYDVLGTIKARHPEIRTTDQVYDSQVGWINRYDDQVVANLDACIGANAKICQAYQARGMAAEKVHQVAHGIDARPLDPESYSPERVFAIKEKLGLPAGPKVVTFASRLHPQKRPMDVVELARRMQGDASVFFLIAGDGPLAAAVDEQIARCNSTNILRRGFYRPISDVLAVTDVLILPSEFEGMPLIVSEAQIMGKPVVVTDVGNNRDVLANTGGGVLVSQLGDVAGMMKGVLQMLQLPPLPQDIRRKFLVHYGMDVIAEKYRRVLLGK